MRVLVIHIAELLSNSNHP